MGNTYKVLIESNNKGNKRGEQLEVLGLLYIQTLNKQRIIILMLGRRATL